MIITNRNKLLTAQVATGSDGSPYISGTLFAVVYLESTSANDAKLWTTASTWEAVPPGTASFPTGSHLKGGLWAYSLTSSAYVAEPNSSIHYTFIDGLGIDNELSSSVLCGGGEHIIQVDIPSNSSISASVWNSNVITDHQAANSAGKLLTDSSGSLTKLTASIWDASILTNHTTAGSAGRLLADASGSSLTEITSSIWNTPSISTIYTTAGTAGRLLSDSSGSNHSLGAISASIWNALLVDTSGTVGSTSEALANASFSGTVNLYESEPTV